MQYLSVQTTDKYQSMHTYYKNQAQCFNQYPYVDMLIPHKQITKCSTSCFQELHIEI